MRYKFLTSAALSVFYGTYIAFRQHYANGLNPLFESGFLVLLTLAIALCVVKTKNNKLRLIQLFILVIAIAIGFDYSRAWIESRMDQHVPRRYYSKEALPKDTDEVIDR
ncbi:MAG: hypothetical protein AB8F78_01505 [Saprospiraceae bacterium]